MKVTFLCTNDCLGGAAIVTHRLMDALRAEGVDARMVVARKSGTSPWVAQVPRARFMRAFLSERLEILLRSGLRRRNLWKVDTMRFGCGVTRHPWVREADTVVLTWVNQGLMSLKDIERLHRMGKRLVWVMHDMWCATGICHHAEECHRYEATCCGCPLLKGGSDSTNADLSTRVQTAKQTLYGHVPIRFVAVSRWLADACACSSTMGTLPVEVIHNAIPLQRYSTVPRLSREQLALPADGALIVMAAARLDDPIKDLPLAIDTLNRLHERPLTERPVAVMCGALKNPEALATLRLPYVHLGTVTDPERMAEIYAHSTAVLSTSVRETLPGTLIEGMAAGATPVTTGIGGQADIVDSGTDGYILPPDTPAEAKAAQLALLLEKAITAPFPREAQRAAVERRFSSSAVTTRFLSLLQDK